MSRALRALLLMLTTLLVGCTAINHDSRPAALPQAISIGIYQDVTLDDDHVDQLLNEVQDHFWQKEGIWIEWAYIRPWERPGFDHKAILKDVWRRPLHGADVLLVLVGRHEGDFIWGLVLPEVCGAVFKDGHNKGFAVAEWGSLNQVLNWFSPKRTVVHEIYHLLGYTD